MTAFCRNRQKAVSDSSNILVIPGPLLAAEADRLSWLAVFRPHLSLAVRFSARVSLCVIGGASIGVGAELVIRDLVVSAGVAPSAYSYDLSSPSGARSGDDDLPTVIDGEVAGRWSLAPSGTDHGVVVGIGLGVEQASSTWNAIQARPAIGYGWAMNDVLTLLGQVDGLMGVSTLRISGGSAFPDARFNGTEIGAGLRATALVQITDGWLAGASAGWRVSQASLTSDDTDVDLQRSGPTFSLSVTWRFSDHPALLE
jgi:hypothetical protein